MTNITVLGAGSFGTAIAHHAACMGNGVTLWCRGQEQADAINGTHLNPRYLKGHAISGAVTASHDLTAALEFASHVILAVPTQSLRSVMTQLTPMNRRVKKFLSLAKGIEISSGKLPHQIAQEIMPDCSYSALSGPSHAEEVIMDLPTAVVVASQSQADAMEWQQLLNSPHFRVYSGDDVLGIELGGAVKNVIAIAVGIAQSLNFGDNATAALATRGLAEIMKIGAAMGASPMTSAGLAGIGDLMVTCYSHHSRNLRFGLAIGRGLSVDEAVSEIGQVVEGMHTVKALTAYAQKAGVELPIAESVYAVLYGNSSVKNALSRLLTRDPKPEMQSHSKG